MSNAKRVLATGLVFSPELLKGEYAYHLPEEFSQSKYCITNAGRVFEKKTPGKFEEIEIEYEDIPPRIYLELAGGGQKWTGIHTLFTRVFVGEPPKDGFLYTARPYNGFYCDLSLTNWYWSKHIGREKLNVEMVIKARREAKQDTRPDRIQQIIDRISLRTGVCAETVKKALKGETWQKANTKERPLFAWQLAR